MPRFGPDHPLADTKLKVERAKRHIQELNRTINAFVRSEPYEIVEEVDAQTGDTLVKFRLTEPVPPEVKAIGGDIISNLRAALDHLTCALAVANGRGMSDTYFPTAEGLDEFKKPSTQEKIKKLSADAQALICALEPYQGGNGEILWALGKLEAPNKHKRFVTMGHRAGGASFDIIQGGGFEMPNPVWDPADESIVLLRKFPNSKAQYKGPRSRTLHSFWRHCSLRQRSPRYGDVPEDGRSHRGLRLDL